MTAGDSIGDIESQTNILSYVVFIVIRMFNLSTMSICIVIMHKFCGSCMGFFIMFNNVVSFMFRIMSRVGKGLFIPLHTLTCIFMT